MKTHVLILSFIQLVSFICFMGCGNTKPIHSFPVEMSPLKNTTAVYRYENDSTISNGFHLGELPIDCIFNKAYFNKETGEFYSDGIVILEQSGEYISEAKLIIGKITDQGDKRTIQSRSIAISDSTGQFTIQTRISKNDVLVVLKWPFLVPVFEIGKLLQH